MASISDYSSSILNLHTETLLMGAKARRWHQLVTGTGSFAKHLALKELYELFDDIADSLGEKCIGAGIVFPDSIKGKTVEFTSPNSAIKEAKSYYSLLQICNDDCLEGELEWLANILQGWQGDLNNILYKLTRLS